MPGFLRSLAKAAVDGYVAAQQHAQAQQQHQYQQNAYYAQQQSSAQYQAPNHHAHPQYVANPQNTQNAAQQHEAQSQSPQLPPRPQNSQFHAQQTLDTDQPPPYEPFDSHPSSPPQASPQQQWQQSPVALPTGALPTPAKTPQIVSTEIPGGTIHQSLSPGCNGFDAIRDGSIFVTSAAPDLDICISCYRIFIASSPFSTKFSHVTDTSQGRKTCDMAVKGVRDAWKDACARAGSATPQQQAVWLEHFSQQSRDVMNRIRELSARAQALQQQVAIGQVQARYTTASSMQQILHGCNMNAINSIDTSSRYHYNSYSAITAAGNNRFVEAQQMQVNVIMQQAELAKLLAEVQALAGADGKGQPTWA